MTTSGAAAPGVRRLLARRAGPVAQEHHTVLRQGYLLMATTVITAALGVAYWAVAARLYTPEEVGRSSAALTSLTLIANVASLNLAGSLPYLLPRLASRRRFLGRMYLLTTVLGLLLALGVLGVLALLPGTELSFLTAEPLTAVFYALAAPAFVLFTVQDGALVGLGRVSAVVVENVVFGVVKLVAVALLAWAALEHGVFASWAGATLLVVPVITALVFRWAREGAGAPAVSDHTGEPASGSIGVLRRFIGLQYAAAMVGQAYLNTLPLVVLLVLGGAQNAFFFLPWTIAMTIDMVSHSMGASLTVEGSKNPHLLARHLAVVARRVGTLLLVGAAVGLVATPLVLAVYGPEYVRESTTLLRLLIVGALLRAVVVIAQSAARARGRTSTTFITELLTAVLLLGVTTPLLPVLGIDAAGWAWVGTNAVAAVTAVVSLRRILRSPVSADPGTGAGATGGTATAG